MQYGTENLDGVVYIGNLENVGGGGVQEESGKKRFCTVSG
jgi:hypothetical protein